MRALLDDTFTAHLDDQRSWKTFTQRTVLVKKRQSEVRVVKNHTIGSIVMVFNTLPPVHMRRYFQDLNQYQTLTVASLLLLFFGSSGRWHHLARIKWMHHLIVN